MIEELFDFERKVIDQSKINKEKITENIYYCYLRSIMIRRWETLKFRKPLPQNSHPDPLPPIRILVFWRSRVFGKNRKRHQDSDGGKGGNLLQSIFCGDYAAFSQKISRTKQPADLAPAHGLASKF